MPPIPIMGDELRVIPLDEYVLTIFVVVTFLFSTTLGLSTRRVMIGGLLPVPEPPVFGSFPADFGGLSVPRGGLSVPFGGLSSPVVFGGLSCPRGGMYTIGGFGMTTIGGAGSTTTVGGLFTTTVLPPGLVALEGEFCVGASVRF